MVPRATLKHGGDVPEIPGYRIEGIVGRGATGVVYRAVQLAFDRTVALKVLHPELVGRGRAIRRLQREARLAARLSHPNLVSSIDMGESGGRWWHAMELVVGPSLAQVLQRDGPLDERRALRLFIPLADVLVHLADAGVVHRDVKPDNVLIDRRGQPHLIDLGLAFSDGDPTMTNPGGTLGTPHYVSPEQARDPTAADTRSDVWSLGATMYHALCGRPPFTGESVAEILSGVLYSPVTDPRELAPQMSKGLALVLRKCLTRAPERRYAHPAELIDDLERLRERRSVRVKKSALDPPAGRALGRRLAVGLGLAVSLALVALLVARPWRAGGADPNVQEAAAPWPPLQEIEDDLASGRTRVGSALRALAELEARVPEPQVAAWRAERVALESRVDREVGRALAACQSEVSAALARRDYELARGLVGGLQERVEEELGLDAAQFARARVRSDWDQRLGAAIESIHGALKLEVERAVSSVPARLTETAGAQVRLLRTEGRWRSARELLTGDRQAWARRYLPLEALPDSELAPVEAAVSAAFDQALRDLDRDWEELDQSLAGWVAEEERRLAREVEAGTFAGDPAAELSARFERRLAAFGVRPEETLDAVSRRGRNALAVAGEALARRARELARRDALAWLEERDAQARELFDERRFAQARELWERASELSIVEPVKENVRMRQREALLLERWLESAAQRVVLLRGREVELWLGGVLARGVLQATEDPLTTGFTLAPPSGRPVRFLLVPAEGDQAGGDVTLSAAGFEQLREQAPLPEDDRPETQLARALFLFRSGLVEEAGTVLDALGALPPEDVALADDLHGRIESAREFDAASLERDRARARQLARTLARLRDSGHPQDRRQALEILDELLGPLLHTPEVQAQKRELRSLRRDLEEPPERDLAAELARALEPTSVELNAAEDGAVLQFDFSQSGFRSNESVGAWTRPPGWETDVYGWRPVERAERAALLDPTAWPRLVLVEPVQVAGSGPVRARLRLRQLEGSGTPTLVAVTFAGWHVALASRGSPGHEEEPRWYAATGGGDALAAVLDSVSSARGRPFPGLERGHTYLLDLELTQSRGQLRLSLAEVETSGPTTALHPLITDRLSLVAPERDEPGTRSLVVRCLEPVRLEWVEIHAGVR